MAARYLTFNDLPSAMSQYMGTWNSYANVMNNFSLDKSCSEPFADFKKQLKLFYRALDPLHKDWFNVFFAPDAFKRDTVYALIKTHYFTLNSKTKNIFICLLYLGSFTYSILQYCEKNGMDGMLSQIQVILTEGVSSLENRFNCEGGLAGLQNFCSSENLPTLLQFISDCYCEKAIFHTFVHVGERIDYIGLHEKEALNLLMNNIEVFENSIREAFEGEMNANLKYKQEVENALSKLRSDLQTGPFQTYLSSDRVKLAADPTSPLSRV